MAFGSGVFVSVIKDSRPLIRGLTGLGNLLLLADRPADARKAFERAVDMAGNNELPTAVANVARAIRAEEGGIGKANAYILALRQAANP